MSVLKRTQVCLLTSFSISWDRSALGMCSNIPHIMKTERILKEHCRNLLRYSYLGIVLKDSRQQHTAQCQHHFYDP